MKQLKIFSAQPNDKYFIWQLQIQLHNFRRLGLSDKYHILIWRHTNRVNGETFDREWRVLQDKYPEAHFHYYEQDKNEVSDFIQSYNYIPLLRPWLLAKHFKLYPELVNDAVLYLDSDVIFTKEIDFSHLIEGDTCYLSDTKSYIGYEYLDSKVKDVLPEKLEEYKTIDAVNGLSQLFGFTRELAETNNHGAGGAQYLLKNIDHTFWEDVFRKCIEVKLYFRSLNRKYFKDEDTGFQSWCADMWSVLYNLWKRGQKTECPKEMDFAWATDYIEKWDTVNIYHDAGASPTSIKFKDETLHKLFYKRDNAYINNIRGPFDDDFSYVSEKYCSYNYVQELIAAR